MNEKLYLSLKKLLKLHEQGKINHPYCFDIIRSEIETYEINNNDDFSHFKPLMEEFGISSCVGKKRRCTERLSIKRAIFFHYLYENYYGKLSVEGFSKVLGVHRTNCYHYIKQYKNYNKFYPITKELQQEFNQILEKYENE